MFEMINFTFNLCRTKSRSYFKLSVVKFEFVSDSNYFWIWSHLSTYQFGFGLSSFWVVCLSLEVVFASYVLIKKKSNKMRSNPNRRMFWVGTNFEHKIYDVEVKNLGFRIFFFFFGVLLREVTKFLFCFKLVL